MYIINPFVAPVCLQNILLEGILENYKYLAKRLAKRYAMNSRQRVIDAINHKVPDKVPFDLGATFASGISIKTLYGLREALGLTHKIQKLFDPYQMLGEVELDIINKLHVDTMGVWGENTFFGTSNREWKSWKFNGMDVLVGKEFNTTHDDKGNIYVYPHGDVTKEPCGMLPAGGYYVDSIVRNEPFDEACLNPKQDFINDYAVLTQDELKFYQQKAKDLYEGTDLALVSVLTPLSINDFAHLPAPWLNVTPGIRNVDEWLIYHYTHPEYINEVHEMHTEVALKNLELYYEAVGDKIQIMILSGADYGTQNGLFISKDMYRQFVMPYQKRVNDWIHKNTKWKTFYHSCGSIVDILDDMIEAGIDIINPVQTSAKGMHPEYLKQKYGDKLVFWGGAIDTQTTLCKGTPEQVRDETLNHLKILSKNGGYVCATTHNIQYDTPIENLLAYIDAVNEFNNKA